jgi:hypothetical protein
MLICSLRIYCVDSCIIELYNNIQQDANNKDDNECPKFGQDTRNPTEMRGGYLANKCLVI